MGGSAGLWQLSGAELLEGYARRDFSPVEVLDDLLGRIERLNPLLRSYLAVNDEDARQVARAAEQRWLVPGEKPLLCGVPVSVKDTIEMKGLPTTYGSLAFKDNYQDDSEIVLRLRRAGAVITGKTNTPEFAMHGGNGCGNRLGEPGTNPWNLEHTCGGSSGGAGSAVAAGLGPMAVGTDSGGSIRKPAAYNGVFGLKPSYQRIPAVQKWRAAPGRSHNGPLSRTVRDSALLMEALAGPDSRDATSEIDPPDSYLTFARGTVRGARIAMSYDLGKGAEPDPQVRRLLDDVAEMLRFLGCVVVEADPPPLADTHQLEPGVWSYSGDHFAGAEAMIPGFWEKHAADLTDYNRAIYEAGGRALAWHYRGALRRNQAYVQAVKEWFRGYDFLICPVDGPAPRLEDTVPNKPRDRQSANFVQQFNFAQTPAASLPFGFHSNGLPLGIQLVGRHGDDLGVLRLAAAIEGQKPWGQHWPELARS
jgi:Asp-tRNA(Asn)/Glu-tRNA(Gln) amidotransferase A subunit family amidase